MTNPAERISAGFSFPMPNVRCRASWTEHASWEPARHDTPCPLCRVAEPTAPLADVGTAVCAETTSTAGCITGGWNHLENLCWLSI